MATVNCCRDMTAHTSILKTWESLGSNYLAALRYISKSQSLTPGIHTSSSCCVTVSPSGEGKGCRSGSLAWEKRKKEFIQTLQLLTLCVTYVVLCYTKLKCCSTVYWERQLSLVQKVLLQLCLPGYKVLV